MSAPKDTAIDRMLNDLLERIEAHKFLAEELINKPPQDRHILEERAKQRGISTSALHRAAEEMPVHKIGRKWGYKPPIAFETPFGTFKTWEEAADACEKRNLDPRALIHIHR